MALQVTPSDSLLAKLTQYKRKYYGNQALRGALVFAALVLGTFLLFNALEFFGRFSPVVRGVLFFSFLAIGLAAVSYFLLDPLSKLWSLRQQISNEEAARQIGFHFPNINDKLLNTLQLSNLSAAQDDLLRASIEQKTSQLRLVRFTDAVDTRQNGRYLRFALAPAALIAAILAFYPRFFSESATRLVNFRNDYAEPAPFSFVLGNASLTAFKGEDYAVKLTLRGTAVPGAVYVLLNGRQYRMETTDRKNYTYTLARVQQNFGFSFEAAGFRSASYAVRVVERPNLRFFNAALTYPAYLNKPAENLSNVGNLVVPDGTTVRWEFNVAGTDSLFVGFEASPLQAAAKDGNDAFAFSKRMRQSENYQVLLKNQLSRNRDKISYYVSVIPDKFPTITLDQVRDSTLFTFLVLGGNVADDYGISQLKAYYRVVRSGDNNPNAPYAGKNLSFDRRQILQNYYYQWSLDSLRLKPGDKVQYFVQVWDNDGVNGSKSAKTQPYEFSLPSARAMVEDIRTSASKTENQLTKAVSQAQKLKKEMQNLENRLKNKRTLDFQDKKMIEEMLQKRDQLMKQLEEIKQQNQELNQKQEKFTEQSQELAKKAEQLQKLMDEMLDDETKKLYEELQKLLEENKQNNDILDQLNKIDKKDNNLKKSLERALEMFKQLQLEKQTEQVIQELREEAAKQEELAEKSAEKKPTDTQQQQLEQQQKQLNEDFKQTEEKINDVEEKNQELEKPTDLPDTEQEQKDIEQEQQDSSDQLEQKQNKKASDAQKKAAKKMQEMADKLSQSQQSEEMEQNQENMDDLRDILENLLKLSFDQEKVMKSFREVNQSDPRFVKLAQEQLKLRDDARIVEDSLQALAKRVFQIESFVTREVGAMNEHMDASTEAIKQRRLNQATGKQQFAMTSMNNLALMLNDVLKQMQEQMANAKPSSGKKKQKGKPQSPSLGQLQKQLNEQIQQLQKGGKQGRELSESLSKLAQEQEMIRRALQELEKLSKGKPGTEGMGDKLKEMAKQMEETEKDLVNKRLSQNTVNRQKDILTRLLESEQSLRERDEDEKREAEKAKDKQRPVPPRFEEYIQNKQKQIELLKTVPPSLSPYYKKEVDEYFNKLRDGAVKP